MRFSTSNQLHINDHLKAHLLYKSCPRTLGTEDLVYGGDSNPRSRGWEYSTLTTQPTAPLPWSYFWGGLNKHLKTNIIRTSVGWLQ